MFNGPGVGGAPVTIGGTGTIQLSIQGEPWTIGAASVSNQTPSGMASAFVRSGYVLGPFSNTSTAAQTGGVIQLVTANQTTAIGIPNNEFFGQITSLRLEFVPEPEILAGLVSGAGALALLGLHRRR